MPGLRAAAPLLAIALLLVASAPPARAQNDTARLLSLRDAWAGLNMFWIGSCPGECATWPFVTWVPGPAPPQFVEGMYVRPVIASANLGSDLSGFDSRGILGQGSASGIPWPTGPPLSLTAISNLSLVLWTLPQLKFLYASVTSPLPSSHPTQESERAKPLVLTGGRSHPPLAHRAPACELPVSRRLPSAIPPAFDLSGALW